MHLQYSSIVDDYLRGLEPAWSNSKWITNECASYYNEISIHYRCD